MRKNPKQYRVCAAYDTETSNHEANDGWHAYPILFIINDLTGTRISEYEPDKNDSIKFYRTPDGVLAYISQLIEYGLDNTIIPIIAAYNLLFDLQPIMLSLREQYNMNITAQSTTSAYTVDLIDNDNGETVLRFWDTSYLERRGLAAMGKTCGFAKATGDWNYDLIRTPETPLTEQELYYAKRDVQVIPAYLKWLLNSEDYIHEEDLGNVMLTATSTIRLFGKRVIGELPIPGSKQKVGQAFIADCRREDAKTYDTYAIRKAQFRGGLTFTGGAYAGMPQRNIASLDVTSMHHTFINGRYVPEKFVPIKNPDNFKATLTTIKNTPIREVLSNYSYLFNKAFNAQIEFTNIRLKGVFADEGIGLLAEAKFYTRGLEKPYQEEGTVLSELNLQAELDIMNSGYKDRALNAEFAFGKLIKADVAQVFINEIEFWNICRVYDFDDYRLIRGEQSWKKKLPPDYITLQSNSLYELKNNLKQIIKNYTAGQPYTGKIHPAMPAAIANEIRTGDADPKFLESYYNTSVKGRFNAIYGSQAQDNHKPDYMVLDNAEIAIDDKTRAINNFITGRGNRINYIYGSRIVGGSRMHLVIAIELLKSWFCDRIRITGGDTDSIKISCDEDVTNDEILTALKPLHDATDKALNRTMQRIRNNYPQYASTLDQVGHFDIENGGGRYAIGCEYWNKCRIVLNGAENEKDNTPHWHITCAGVSRPATQYTLEDIADRLLDEGFAPEHIIWLLMGYNTTYDSSVSYLLGHRKPLYASKIDENITDYTGKTSHVNVNESIALYPISKEIGDDTVATNRNNITYARKHGNDPRVDPVEIQQDNEYIYIYINYTLKYKVNKW